jgi:hypothetical protein
MTMHRRLRLVAALASIAPVLAAVSAQAGHAAPRHAAASSPAADKGNPAHCDPIGGWKPGDGRHDCLLPFPNNYFTKVDKKSITGRRVALTANSMPVNAEGKGIQPAPWRRADGFSVGAQLLTYVPGMTKNSDIGDSKMPRVDTIGHYTRPDAGVVVINAKTKKRFPVWAEVDQYTDESGATHGGSVEQDLMIHPAVNFRPKTHYIVALRHVVLDNGKHAKPTKAFKAYRDGTAPKHNWRTQHFERLFRRLGKAGIDRHSLYLAWDFTTASSLNTTGRLLAIRDNAFARLGDQNLSDGHVQGSAPSFKVNKVTDNPNDEIAKVIQGRFSVPCYVAPSCVPTGKFILKSKSGLYGTPERMPVMQHAKFICVVPKGKHSLRPSLYGHGLFGGADEVEAGNVEDMARRHHMLECATNWFGMATADIPNAVADIADLSLFETLVDRVEQGELDFLYLARLMVHGNGLCSSTDFQHSDGSCIIDRTTAYYDGNSQGGIYGGVVCAVIPDANRCVLGVPGQDYSVLLPRSSDYVSSGGDSVPYSELLDSAYPDQSQRMLIMDLIQMLWDRGDPDGYARHMTDHPLRDSPVHHVLLQMAWGDHQVTNIEAETEARTIGADLVTPAIVTDRYGKWRDPFWGLTPMPGKRYDGSALTVFDTGPVRSVNGQTLGTDPPPRFDAPTRNGVDPHGAPRSAECGQDQKSAFLKPAGKVTEPCTGPPYFGFDWNGTDGL